MSGTDQVWLDDLVDATRERVDAGFYDQRPETDLEPNGSLAGALRAAAPAVIAEIKPARPEGQSFEADVREQAERYAKGGACGISVLTDPDHFDGKLSNLQQAGEAGLPLLMKDFLIDERQVHAAQVWGASAVLAIARLPREGYTDYTLDQAVQDAHEAGIEVLAEVVTEAEFEQALDAGADAIGINVRDLDTLELDADRVTRLLEGRELDVPVLHLSDVSGPKDVEGALEAGADGVLVGTHVMAADDPEQAVRDLSEVPSA